MATGLGGDIWWANEALENMMGYTASELRESVKWTDMTVDHGDLHHDLAMAEELVHGSRIEYQLVKQLKHKSGESISVSIHVLRHPLQGDFNCFLVSVRCLNEGPRAMLRELQEMQSTMLEIMDRQEAAKRKVEAELRERAAHETFWGWCKDNPRKAAVLGAFGAFLVVGDRVIEFISAIRDIL